KVSFKIDNASGVSNNSKLSYKADNKTLAQVLDEVCTLNDMGYVIISKPGDRYDGWVLIRKGKGKERGYEAGKEPKEKSSAVRPGPRQQAGDADRLLLERRRIHGVGVEQHLVAGPELLRHLPELRVEHAQQAALDLPQGRLAVVRQVQGVRVAGAREAERAVL